MLNIHKVHYTFVKLRKKDHLKITFLQNYLVYFKLYSNFAAIFNK